MTPTDHQITSAMILYGGSFVRTLGELWSRGDPVNRARVQAAFPDYWAEYADMVRIASARIARERDERQKGDDDGVEYADPRDYRDGRE